jgi:apolipoprotein N-acyltransferase
MIRAHSANGALRILMHHIKKLTATYPETSIIIMPESALDIIDHNILGKFHEAYLQKPLHLICGACHHQDQNYYNSLYWIHNGALQVRFDKKHVMLMTERLADWMNVDWLRKIYFKDDVSITRSCNERKLLQISESVAFVPYICSELFFNEYPDDCYHDKPIIAIVNDTLLIDSYMQDLLLLLAQFKAIQWQRHIVYVSYGASIFINKQGMVKEINE